jgi:hypothetical protein
MKGRFRRRAAVGVVAGIAAAVATAGIASVGAAGLPTGGSAVAKQYPEKVTICHRTGSKKNPFVTIRVSQNALKAHLKHGDARGACGPNSVFTMCHKTKGGKQQTFKVKGARKAKGHLKKGDKLGKCKSKGKPEKTKGKQKGKEKNKGHGKKKGGGPKKP